MPQIASTATSRTDRVPPARRIRRMTAGLCLIGFPALLIPQAIVDPTDSSTFQDAAVRHPDALFISGLLLLGSALLTFPAIGGILHQARDRGALLADIGAVFAALGALGHAVLSMIYLLMRSTAGGDPAAMLAFEERFDADDALTAVGLVLLVSFGVGLALLAWAAWRSGIVGLWGPVLITAVVLAHNVLPENLPALVSVVAIGVITAVFGWIGVRTIGLSDDEWEAPPARATVAATA
jgi:hypothetical protein